MDFHEKARNQTSLGYSPPQILLLELQTQSAHPTMCRQRIGFCDMCSPYYAYGMLCCGIPAVNVLGTADDYKLMKHKWDDLAKLFPDLSAYFSQVSATLQSIVSNLSAPDFWTKMFNLERCGSGGEVEVEGWITTLFKDVPSIRYVGNYTTGVSVMEYTNFSTGKKYKMQDGLFFSRMEGVFLVPKFGFTIHEILEPKSTTDLAELAAM